MTIDLTAPRVAYLALGSNLGDRAANIEEAVRRLDGLDAVRVGARASLYQTAPMYVVDQPEFLNTCVEVHTTLDPHALLDACLDVERAMGRVRTTANGPRNIDIDIVLYEDIEIDDDRLTIPHPAMHERDFVMAPLREINAPAARRPASE